MAPSQNKKQTTETSRRNTSGVATGTRDAASVANRGAISQLQEFVQATKICPLASSCPVLQWNHDTRMVETSLEFCATVSFLLDGIPHHIVGGWKTSKKLAQRDAAERAMVLFVGQWGNVINQQEIELHASTGSSESDSEDVCNVNSNVLEPVQDLEYYCLKESMPHPQFTYIVESGRYQALVEILMFGIPHTFEGRNCESQELACEDAARRVLWYFQQPGYEDIFEPDIDLARRIADKIPEPPSVWGKDNEQSKEEQQSAHRKTTVMRVQNRLQQAYAGQLEAGASIWQWVYEHESKDTQCTPIVKASVHIPFAGRTFAGKWARSQHESQMSVCTQINEFLDAEFTRTRFTDGRLRAN